MSYTINNTAGKRNGLIVTVVFHAILLILCLFLGFNYYTPPKGGTEIGIEALGIEDGGNSDELATSEEISETSQEVSEAVNQSASNPDEKSYATQENSPVDVASNKPVKPEKTPEQIQKENEEREKNEKIAAIRNRVSNALKGPNNSGGKGDGGNPGNQGGENGIPGGDGGAGGIGPGGPGGGGSKGGFDFGNRKAKTPGNLKHECGVQGSVKVRVKVDRMGNVVDAVVVGGTSFNECLRKIAVSAAKSTKYYSNPSGPEFQEGPITLNFSLN